MPCLSRVLFVLAQALHFQGIVLGNGGSAVALAIGKLHAGLDRVLGSDLPSSGASYLTRRYCMKMLHFLVRGAHMPSAIHSMNHSYSIHVSLAAAARGMQALIPGL